MSNFCDRYTVYNILMQLIVYLLGSTSDSTCFYEHMFLLFLCLCIMVYHHTDMFYILRALYIYEKLNKLNWIEYPDARIGIPAIQSIYQRATCSTVRVRSPATAGTLLYVIETGSCAPPTHIQRLPLALSPGGGGKAAGAWSWKHSSLSSAEINDGAVSTPRYVPIAWCLAN
jgi:hypothetical protein